MYMKKKIILLKALNNLLSSKDEQVIKNSLILIGDICENSKNKHNELIQILETKLETFKEHKN